jgi:hypothetical protein
MEGSGEAEPGVVVAGSLVTSHRDPAPLLELVEVSLDDVAAAVAVPLLVAEVDWPSSPPAAVGDLIVAFRDRRGGTSLAQPGPIRTGGVALVREHAIGASTRATRRSGNTDLLKCLGQNACVGGLARGKDERQRPALPVEDQMVLGRQATAGTSNRMDRRLVPKLLVIRRSPP